jgi:hypothetical protein
MIKQDLDFLANVWLRLTQEAFSPQQLADLLRNDGGVDIRNLSESDVLELIEGQFNGDWREPAFTFSEILGFYAAHATLHKRLTKKQVVAWIFASFVVAEAVRQDVTDLELKFNKFIDGFLLVRDELDVDESTYVFQRFFARNSQAKTLNRA